ncbi:fimbria/pilus outer membrane usher protein, partial [Klebsiella pneumoniae]
MDDSKLRYFASAWLISITLPADSAERYNAQFVNGIDPLAFNQFVASDGDVMPGTYDVNIYINDLLVDSRPVRFSEDSAHGGLAPCLSAAEYIRYGVKIDDDHQPCFALSQTIRQAEQQLDIANHRLIIHIPQQYIEHYPRDYVSPMRFDEGINAAFVNYSYSTDANNGDGGSHQYQYLSLNSGINIASWRLRNNAYWNKFSGQADKWQSIASWAETNIIPWRSRLVVGQTSTDNSVFDSVQFRGVQLGTDVEMRPSSQTGFAPVIRGVANSNARVEVRQNNYLIYSENVPAGPFELNDISAVNRSGDFYVTVIEADGSQTTFTVAYTTLPQLVRAGQWNYQLSAGKYHDGADGYAPALMQSSLSYGLNNTFTLYG